MKTNKLQKGLSRFFDRIFTRMGVVIIIMGIITVSCSKSPSKLRPHDLFTNHMVLQRDISLKVFGMATPGTRVTVTFDKKEFKAKADQQGNWETLIGEYPAGGPYEMTIAAHDTNIHIADILVGDIWVCSGQSNMEWTLSKSMKGSEELLAKRSNTIRCFMVEKDIEFFPLDTLRKPAAWFCADSSLVAKFSAVGYYFGKNLNEKLNVPIGLIGSNWGGTIAEAWTSTESIQKISDFDSIMDELKTKKMTAKETEALNNKAYNDFLKNEYYKDKGMDEKWFLPENGNEGWTETTVPALWEESITELKDFNGVVWYKKTFDVPKDFMGNDLEMWFGQIDDHNMAWVNGEKLGEKFGRTTWSGYTVPAKVLKEKGNVIVIRVFDVVGMGGFSGNPTHFDFYPDGIRKERLSTAGKWLYKKSDAFLRTDGEMLVSSNLGPNDYPTGLYNSMIHPLIKFPIKGAIWYQGESNASRAYQYRTVFSTMINDWREKWNIGDFAFYFVQLANFMETNTNPVESEWAELREAQTMALKLPNTGMATIIDLGEAEDIHPTNKHDVGYRLAMNALKVTYGLDIVSHGPMYKEMKAEGNKVILSFDGVGSGLKTSDKIAPVGFAIAGEDKKFYWAKAEIKDQQIILTCDKVNAPVAVRYAWSNNPITNLYNNEGFPAVPFRTDDWAGLTLGKK